MANKIKYGLSNVHYAPITAVTDAGVPTYGTPKPLIGAVNLSLTASGDATDFYADDVLFFHSQANNGYTGTLEIAKVNADFKKDCLGQDEDTDGVLFESADDVPVEFALLFQFKGDVSGTKHCMYRCLATRPDVASATKTASIEVQTETLNITAMPRLDNQIVKSECPATATAYATWFSAVYE